MDTQTATDQRIAATLRSTFGFTSFRPLQEEVVRSVLRGQDVFVLMPTGGGKSLCYQLPALLLDGMTVVVSPLIALMKDQVDALQALGVPATCINSSLDPGEANRRQAAVARGEVKLLYVAPERLMLSGFLHLLSTVRLSFFAIDEAHCISEWGHDFRPEYRQLRQVREHFPSTVLGAFTATATPRVQADIKSQLGLQRSASFQGSYNRSNLFYDVRPKQSAYRELVAYLRTRPRASGIIYCQARAGTERLAAKLRADGFSAAAYHAGMESLERGRTQESFIRDDTRIIVATIAFGMGIDKPDVRFVVHYDLPKNLEGYYQESGRAGRDGEPSDCILFFSYGDKIKYQHFIDEKPTENERQIATQQLRRMVDWAESTTCRRRALLAYFDESFEGQSGPCCDVCTARAEGVTPAPDVDYTVPAQMYLSCAIRTGERFGSTHLIDVLRGSHSERVLRLGHDKLTTHGIGRDRSKEEWTYLSRALLREGYTRQDENDFNSIKVTERGRAVLRKEESVILPEAPQRAKAVPEPEKTTRGLAATGTGHPDGSSPVDEALFEELRTLRKRLADERGVPPYVVFHDTTLRQMAAEFPTSHTALLGMYGVGERKALDYGEAFLDCIARYAQEHGIELNSRPTSTPIARPPARLKGELGDSVWETLDLFRRGMTIPEIIAFRGLASVTIEGHLVEALDAGEELEIDRLVSPEKRRDIEEAMAEVDSEFLRPVMDYLGNGYTYNELRFVRAALRWGRIDSSDVLGRDAPL